MNDWPNGLGAEIVPLRVLDLIHSKNSHPRKKSTFLITYGTINQPSI